MHVAGVQQARMTRGSVFFFAVRTTAGTESSERRKKGESTCTRTVGYEQSNLYYAVVYMYDEKMILQQLYTVSYDTCGKDAPTSHRSNTTARAFYDNRSSFNMRGATHARPLLYAHRSQPLCALPALRASRSTRRI